MNENNLRNDGFIAACNKWDTFESDRAQINKAAEEFSPVVNDARKVYSEIIKSENIIKMNIGRIKNDLPYGDLAQEDKQFADIIDDNIVNINNNLDKMEALSKVSPESVRILDGDAEDVQKGALKVISDAQSIIDEATKFIRGIDFSNIKESELSEEPVIEETPVEENVVEETPILESDTLPEIETIMNNEELITPEDDNSLDILPSLDDVNEQAAVVQNDLDESQVMMDSLKLDEVPEETEQALNADNEIDLEPVNEEPKVDLFNDIDSNINEEGFGFADLDTPNIETEVEPEVQIETSEPQQVIDQEPAPSSLTEQVNEMPEVPVDNGKENWSLVNSVENMAGELIYVDKNLSPEKQAEIQARYNNEQVGPKLTREAE